MSWDYASQKEAQAGPGADTRIWCSNGVVNADQPSAPAVSFASKVGPLVSVRLHPSDTDVRCRVASFIAGAGEGEWHPFGGGDEVVVVFPQGSERGGGIIVGRLNNGVDTAPTNVANNDVTQNNLTTRRSIPNYAWEIENGWILRSSTTTAQLALDRKGGWIMSSGDTHFVSLSSTGAILSIANMQSYLSIDASSGQISVNAGKGKAGFLLDPSSGIIFATTSSSVPLAGPVGRVATIEGTLNLLLCVLGELGALMTPPVTGAQVVAAVTAGLADVPAGTCAGAIGGPIPFTAVSSLLAAALAVPRDPTGLILPSLGCPAFQV